MALSAQQRQKKREQKKKKRESQNNASADVHAFLDRAARYASCPIHECIVPSELFDIGIGHVFVTRRTPEGLIAVGGFLVDVYCLGVKDALFKVMRETEYEHTIKHGLIEVQGGEGFETVSPACAKKLIDGAITFADRLGLSPHRDYRNVKDIFGDTDAAACPVDYTYGKDGEPLYMRGPGESVGRANRIIRQLTESCGEGNFHYLVAMDDDAFAADY